MLTITRAVYATDCMTGMRHRYYVRQYAIVARACTIGPRG